MRTSHKHTHTRRLMGKQLIGVTLLLLAALVLPTFYRGTTSEAAKTPFAATVNPAPKAPWELGYRSRGNQHKLHVQDQMLALELQTRGARVIADYGSYKLMEADTAMAQSLAPSAQVELRDDNNLILLHARPLDTTSAEVKALRGQRARKSAKTSSKGMWLVQFAGPIKPEWYGSMLNTGVEIVNYIPNNAYLVYGDADTLSRLQNWARESSFVQWDGDYRSEFKEDPQFAVEKALNAKEKAAARAFGPAAVKAAEAQQEASYVQVQLIKDTSTNAATLQRVTQLAGSQSLARQYEIARFVNVTVKLPTNLSSDSFAKSLSDSPDIVFISPYKVPRKFDERQNNIVAGNISGNVPTATNYLNYLGTQGFTQGQFTTSNFAVNVTDSGIDNATTNVNHFALRLGGDISAASRVIYNRLEGTPNGGSTLQGCDGHGNINAHIVAGFVPNGTLGGVNFGAAPHMDASGFRYGLGVAPFVKVGSTVIFDPNSFTFPSYPSIESKAYNDGARISTNSWGASVGGAYNSDSQAYDFLVRDAQPTGAPFTAAGNQEMVILFAAGNDGSGANTVGSPGTGKNVITAGASENVHPFGAADQCGTSDTGADSLNDIIGFSSRGPCDDGRIKPDLVAPGTHVSGGVFQASAVATGNGVAGACFNAGGVCAGPGVSNFWPTGGQQFYTASSGTSHSTPAIAGAAALIRQRFINASLTPPSPAMTKATLLNSARYMTGTGANDNLFSNNQGMGLMNLNNLFDHFNTPTILRDQVSADTFTATGQQRVFVGTVSDTSKPFRITLSWTDVPGPTSGNAFVNNLDLEVTVNGQTYKGNVFTGQFSTTGGTADSRNNTESIVLPAGTSGSFVVTVKATNIAGDGVPNSGGTLDQDFALVIYNAAQANIPVINSTIAVTAEDCALDGKVDPGENITISLCLNNLGTASTGNVTAGLLATGGVTSPSSSQSYGVLAPNAAAVCRTFTFRADPSKPCGTNVTTTFAIQDGNNPATNVSQVFGSGTPTLTFSQNFDSVTVPALPSGWIAANASGAAPLWVSSTASPDSAPNAVFVDNPSTVSDKRLDSPAINISSASAQLTFRHAFSLESGFDGGVLEASVNGGAFVDVTNASVGGTFVTGGYTGTISTDGTFQSPILGRPAWTGFTTGGSSSLIGQYITTTVQFGAALQNKTVIFRWRMGSDSTVGRPGWRVDNVQVFGDVQCCVKITPVVKLTDPAVCTGPGNLVAGSIAATNPTASPISGTVTTALPAGLLALPGGCSSNVGTCTVVNAATISWTGTLPAGGTLNISYNAQIGDVPNGTQLCAVTTGNFGVVGLTPVQACLTANCPAVGPGTPIPPFAPGDGPAPPSDQKAGSVLFYPVYTSGTDPIRQNTRISMTNIEPARSSFVHLFFVDGTTCSVADAFVCLTPNQTVTFLTSDLDPGTTGYLVAIAVDRDGCPTNFNYLIGDEYVKFATGHQANLGAEAIPALPGGLLACQGATAEVRFDGVSYAPVPRTLALDNVASRADSNDTMIIINRVGGDLLTAASSLTSLFGVMYDDAENGVSFTVNPRVCQFRATVDNNFPRTTPRFDQFVPAGRSAWFKFYSTADQGLFGCAINFNSNANASANAFNQGHNLHKLTFTTGMRYIVPVLPVSCQ